MEIVLVGIVAVTVVIIVRMACNHKARVAYYALCEAEEGRKAAELNLKAAEVQRETARYEQGLVTQKE